MTRRAKGQTESLPGTKCPRANYSEVANSFFEKLFSIANASKSADSVTLKFLKELKNQVLSEDKESIRKAARDFTLNEVVQDFGLEYSSGLMDAATYRWKIETLPEVKTFQPSACLGKASPYVI